MELVLPAQNCHYLLGWQASEKMMSFPSYEDSGIINTYSNLVWRLQIRREHLTVISAPPTVTLIDDQMVMDYDVTRQGAVIHHVMTVCTKSLITDR
jgi:hypothetical protein